MGALAVPSLTVEQYLALDRAAEFKSEYHDGEMFPIAAVSLPHGRLSVTVGAALEGRLKQSECRAVGSSMRVRVSQTKFVCPDILVFCGKPALTDEHADTRTNPKVIFEILSPSTQDYDYGTKFSLYRQLPSFEEYVLISQTAHLVEVYRRTPESRWLLSTYAGPDAVFPVESLGITIPLAEIYSGVL